MKTQTKFSFLKFALSFYFLITFNYCLFAQKIDLSTSITGSGKFMTYPFKGLIGNKEIRSNVRSALTKYNYNLLVFENNKQILKKDMEISYNKNKYVPVDYFIKDDKIVSYFIAGTKNSTEVKLCVQEFNSDLEQIGIPVEVVQLPNAIDPSKLLDNKSGGMFSDKDIQKQDLVAKYDKETGNILFCFSLQLKKEHDLSYCKVILLNGNYSILNTYEYKAISGENYIKASPQAIFENGDALVSISEGINKYDDAVGDFTFNISKQAQFFIPSKGNDATELELIPEQSRVLNNITAENLSKDNTILYSILSTNLNTASKNYYEDKKGAIGYISTYKYNITNKTLSQESFQYNIGDLFNNDRALNASHFHLKKMYNLKDGSTLLWLISSGVNSEGYAWSNGSIFIKIDANNTISWVKDLRKKSLSYTQYSGELDYFNQQGNLNLVFNFHPDRVKEDNLELKGKNIIDLGSVPVIATIDISSGEITFKKMTVENTVLGGVLISESEKLDNEGRYRMHMMINKKLQFVDIDFNAN